MRYRLSRPGATVMLAGALLITTACSSTSADSELPSKTTISTEQLSAPHGPDDSSDLVTLPSTTGTNGTLPGLSPDCSAVIHAQAAVNKLFSDAITPANDSESNAQESTTPSSSGTAVDEGTASAGSVAASSGGPITDEKVATVFEDVDGTVPPAMEEPFATLHAAAEKVVGKSAAKVSEELTAADTMTALSAIADYISDCEPTPDD